MSATPNPPPAAAAPAPEPRLLPLVVGFTQPKPRLRWLAILLALAGWYASFELFGKSTGRNWAPLTDALCGGATAASDCDAVTTSPLAYIDLRMLESSPTLPKLVLTLPYALVTAAWARVVGPLPSELGKAPVSFVGMLYFAFVALWYLCIGPPTRSRRAWHLILLAVVLVGAALSADFVWQMHSVLHRWCIGCLVVHGLNGLLVLLTLLAWPFRRSALPRPPHPTFRWVAATLALALTTAGIHVGLFAGWRQNEQLAAAQQFRARLMGDVEFLRWDYERRPVIDLALTPDETFGGRPDAPHTLVVFGDFLCSHCKELHERLQEVAREHPDQVRVAFRYYPMDGACNPRFAGAGWSGACRAACAAEAVRRLADREAYLAYRGKLWAAQGDLPKLPLDAQTPEQREIYERLAEEVGVAREKFRALLDAPEVSGRITGDIVLAERIGEHEMPAVFFDGRKVTGWGDQRIWALLLGGK